MLKPAFAESTLGIRQGLLNDLLSILPGEGFQHIGAGAGQQRVIQFEGGILRGGPDKHHRAILHMGQKGILLRFIEAVHLVDEQHRGTVLLLLDQARLLHCGADILDPGEHRGKAEKMRAGVVRDDPGQGGFAGAWRTPEDHRVEPVLLDRPPQGLTLGDDMGLADKLIQGPRSHAVRQRAGLIAGRFVEQVAWTHKSPTSGLINPLSDRSAGAA